MNCFVCTTFMDYGRISFMNGFQQQWCESGSKLLEHSARLEHAGSISCEKAFNLHLKGLGLIIWERREKEQLLLSSIGQQPIVNSINVMNKKDFRKTKNKFESAYFLAKNEAPLSLFLKLVSHEERHGVIVGTAYRNRTLGTLFLEYITKNLKEGLKEKLNMRNFYSSLTDGSTDSAVNKKEAFYVLTFYLNHEGSTIASVELNYFDLAEPKT